ncbi:terminase large subunit [Tistrella bauzanensis]|uniref:terminase large subunit n=1 Tax=Tistrella TaxID=171436 RepID=UPI0031F600D6
MRDYAAIAERYALDAVADRKGVSHCKWVRAAAKRHLDDLKKSRRKSGWLYEYSAWHGNDVCDFVEKLPHVQGSWSTSTITLEPAQIFILAVLFGWRKISTEYRRFTVAYIEMARKNAKSTISAGVALYCLCCPDEDGPEIKLGATTFDQALKVFEPARQMVLRCPEMTDELGIQCWARSITAPTGSMQPIHARAKTQDGHNPSLTVMDELHAHDTSALWDVMRSAMGARKSPLLLGITTAGYNVQGVCYETRKTVAAVLDGKVIADHLFGVIYTLDDGDDEYDERNWIKANPLLGVSVGFDEMRGYAIEAQQSSTARYEFRTKRLNVWTTDRGAWLDLRRWDSSRYRMVANDDELVGLPCWAGLDLATTTDITALALVWRGAEGDDGITVRWRMWAPADRIAERTRKHDLPYQAWVDAGWLTATDGDVTDYAVVEAGIREWLDKYQVQSIGYDPWNSSDLINRLCSDSATAERMVQFRQGPSSYNAPMREMERLIIKRRIDHGRNPVAKWMAGNVVTRADTNLNIAPDRKKSADKIDGICAALMALGVSMTAEAPVKSFWEE